MEITVVVSFDVQEMDAIAYELGTTRDCLSDRVLDLYVTNSVADRVYEAVKDHHLAQRIAAEGEV